MCIVSGNPLRLLIKFAHLFLPISFGRNAKKLNILRLNIDKLSEVGVTTNNMVTHY